MNGVRLTGLWKHTSKDGKLFLSGAIGAAKVLVLQNEFKKEPGDPDFNLFLAPREEKRPLRTPPEDLF